MAEGIADDLLSCSLCLEMYIEPKSLPCLHTFCLSCLRKYVSARTCNTSLPCPLCQNLTTIPGKSVDNFPTNFMIKDMMARFNKSQTGAEETGAKTPASPSGTWRNFHQHQEEQSGKCAACERETSLQFYCQDCSLWLCDVCGSAHQRLTVTSHHKLLTLDEINAKCMRRLERKIDLVVDIGAGVKEKSKHLRQERSRIAKEEKELKEIISASAKRVIESVEQQKVVLFEEVEEFYGAGNSKVGQQLTTCERLEKMVKNYMAWFHELKRSGDGVQSHKFLEELEEFIRQHKGEGGEESLGVVDLPSLVFSDDRGVTDFSIGQLSQGFTVTVLSLDKKKKTQVCVQQYTRVGDVMGRVAGDSLRHRLVHDGRRLEDDKLLTDYNIQAGSRLELAPRQRGEFATIEEYKTYMRDTVRPGDQVRCLAGCGDITVYDTGRVDSMVDTQVHVLWDLAARAVSVGCWRLEIIGHYDI